MPAFSRKRRISFAFSGSGLAGAVSPRTRIVILSAVASLNSVPRMSCAISSSSASSRALLLVFFGIVHLLQPSGGYVVAQAFLAASQDVAGCGLQVLELARADILPFALGKAEQ